MYNSEVSRANLNFRVYTLKQITFKLPKPLDTTYLMLYLSSANDWRNSYQVKNWIHQKNLIFGVLI